MRTSNMRIRKRLQNFLGLTKWYGQRQEDKIIAAYFGDFSGTLLSIGENDGRTYSNVLHFIQGGWKADLVEPSPIAFRRLMKRHLYNDLVYCHQMAISQKTGKQLFWDSGELIGLGDTGLVSTLHPKLVRQWHQTAFCEMEVRALTFPDFLHYCAHYQQYDLISIDAEGEDLAILQQTDLRALGCRCVVIERGGDPLPFRALLSGQGYRQLAQTEENFIYIR